MGKRWTDLEKRSSKEELKDVNKTVKRGRFITLEVCRQTTDKREF